jgi:hypothetical protein
MSRPTAVSAPKRVNPLRLERLEDRTNPASLNLFLSLAQSFAANQVPLASASPAGAGILPTVQQTATQFVARFNTAAGLVGPEITLGSALANFGSNTNLLLKNATAADLAALNQATATFQASFGPGKTGFDRAVAQADLATAFFRIEQRSAVLYLNNLPAVTKALGEFTKAAGEFGQAMEAYYFTQFFGVLQDLTSDVQSQGQGFSDFVSDVTQGVDDGINGLLQNAEGAQQDAIDALGHINLAQAPGLATQLAQLAQNNATLQVGMIAIFQAEQAAAAQISAAELQVGQEASGETTANFNAENAAFIKVGLAPVGLVADFADAAFQTVNDTADYISNERDNLGDVFDQLTSDLFDAFGDALQDRADLVALGVPASAFTVP